MITATLYIVALILTIGVTGDKVAPPPKRDARVIQWLDKIEAAGKKTHSLCATVIYDKNNTLLGDRQIRTGEVAYLAADREKKTPAKFAVQFKKLIVDDAMRDHPLEYIFDGTWLVEKDHKKKMFIKRQVVEPGKTFDPLKIDGPFPLPLGQKRKDVMSRFNVKIIPPSDKDKDKDISQLHLRLTPRDDAPKVEGRKQFDRIDMWYDSKTLTLQRVFTVEKQTVESTVTLTDVKLNTIDDKQTCKRFDTTTPPPGSGWRVDIRPWKK